MDGFYNSFLALCAQKGVSPSGAAKAIGLSNAAASGWKKGKTPSGVTLAKLTQYFGVSADYFRHSERIKIEPTPDIGGGLTETQRKAVELIKTLDETSLRKFIRAAKAMLED